MYRMESCSAIKIVCIFFCILCCWAVQDVSAIDCGGDGVGWVAFSDEKCIKILDSLVSHDDATNLCLNEMGGWIPDDSIPPLLTIKSSDEQKYLTQFLFDESGLVDNVWLGASRITVNDTDDEDVSHQFEWSDGSKFQFTNWREGSPTNHSENGCVQMTPSIQKIWKSQKKFESYDTHKVSGEGDGFWTDVSCIKRNLVVCQKLPIWSNFQIQKTVIEMRRNPVPIGFIYVQLPDQPEPKETWPNLGWEDVTLGYGGLFFRAEGGESAAFGTVQKDQTRRITQVQGEVRDTAGDVYYPGTINLPENEWSEFGFAGAVSWSGDSHWQEALRFYTNEVEVRPKNTAVKIWKRIY